MYVKDVRWEPSRPWTTTHRLHARVVTVHKLHFHILFIRIENDDYHYLNEDVRVLGTDRNRKSLAKAVTKKT